MVKIRDSVKVRVRVRVRVSYIMRIWRWEEFSRCNKFSTTVCIIFSPVSYTHLTLPTNREV